MINLESGSSWTEWLSSRSSRRIVLSKHDENWPVGSRGARVLHWRNIACTFLWAAIGEVAHLSCTHRYPSTLNAPRGGCSLSKRIGAADSYHPALRPAELTGGLVLIRYTVRNDDDAVIRRGAFTSSRPGTPEISYFTRPRSVSSCKWYENRVSTSGSPHWLRARAVPQVSLPRSNLPVNCFRCPNNNKRPLESTCLTIPRTLDPSCLKSRSKEQRGFGTFREDLTSHRYFYISCLVSF